MPPTLLFRRTMLKVATGITSTALFGSRGAMASESSMVARRIRGGETLPCIGLGTYGTFDVTSPRERDEAKMVLADFAKLGGKLVDSSPMYGAAESVVGDAAKSLGLGGKLFLATKVWTDGASAGIQQARTSMQRMKTDRLDLLQVHNLVDVDTHLKWLREWKEAGRIRYVGVSHYTESAYPALERFIASSSVDFVQFNYSIAEPAAEKRLLPAALESDVAVIINRPFAQAGLFRRVQGRPVPEWAREFGATTWAQFFLKYILGHPAVTCVIPATRNRKHLADNMGAGFGPLPAEKMRRKMVAALG